MRLIDADALEEALRKQEEREGEEREDILTKKIIGIMRQMVHKIPTIAQWHEIKVNINHVWDTVDGEKPPKEEKVIFVDAMGRMEVGKLHAEDGRCWLDYDDNFYIGEAIGWMEVLAHKEAKDETD